MKHIIIIFLLFLSHCQSVSNYLQYRAYDFRDMFTIGVEKNVAGGSFFVWCFGGGLQYGSEGNGYGIRGGSLGEYTTGYKEEIPEFRRYLIYKYSRRSRELGYYKPAEQLSVPFNIRYGSSYLKENSLFSYSENASMLRTKDKNYSAVNFFGVLKVLSVPSDRWCEMDQEFCDLSKRKAYCNSPFQIETSVGLYYGLRLGFNFYEALDFVTGIFGADILDDDTLAPMTEKDRKEMLSQIHYDNSGTHLAWMGESCSRARICSEGLCVNSICQDKEIQNTKNWTGGFCNKHHHCKNGVCLDGTCMAKEMENTYPWKCKDYGCGVSGASCKLDTECKGICVNGKCQ